jgi:hypothetical protein
LGKGAEDEVDEYEGTEAVVRTDLTGQEMMRSEFILSIENVRERN